MAFHPFSTLAGDGRAASRAPTPGNFSLLQDLGRPGHHYDPGQPRVPAGHPDGGQWTRLGGRLGAPAADRTTEKEADRA
jgi:hypothetical protein